MLSRTVRVGVTNAFFSAASLTRSSSIGRSTNRWTSPSSAHVQRVAGELAGQDVDDRQPLAPVGRGDDGAEGRAVDCRPGQADRLAVVVDDLDVIRPLGQPRPPRTRRPGRAT